MRGARSEGLSRRHRFTVHGAFGNIFRNSRKLRTDHVVLHVSPGRPGMSRFGIAIARRVMPSAVQRNRVKRALREAFRRHPVKLVGVDVVAALRKRPDPAAERAMVAEVIALLDRAREPH
jgi:ribonuclease P protein component